MLTSDSSKNDSFKRVLHYSRRYWKQLLISGVCASFFGIFSASPSYLVQHTVDEVFVKRLEHLLIPFILCFLLLYLLKGIFMYLSAYYMNWVGNRVVNDLRTDLFGTIIYFPASFFREKTTGGLMALFFNDISLIQNTASSAIRNGLRCVCEASFLLVVAFIQSWKLTLLMMIVGPLVALSLKRLGGMVRIASRTAQNKMGTISSLLRETLSGVREIKSFNTEKTEINRFSSRSINHFDSIMRCVHFEALAPAVIEVVAMLGIGIVLYVASREVLQGVMTPGQLTSFFAAVLLAYQPVKRLINVYADVQYALGSADRIFSTMDMVFPADKERHTSLPSFSDNITFDNVSFSYPNGTPVLKNVNLNIKKGESVGIIGPSGAGKSTFCDLLLGFITPTEGVITIDGHNTATASFKSLRSQIGYVSQHPFLFNDTVQANVLYAAPSTNQSEIEKACKAAHAHEFIQTLPQGYQTMVGEEGSSLSGGQKQRLTIARALLKDAPILVFDEATSALDLASEEMIKQALQETARHKTVVVISHRLSFIEAMDRIFTIENGSLIEISHQNRRLFRQSNVLS